MAQSLPKTYMKYMVVQIRFTQVELVGKPCGAQQTGLAGAGLGKHFALINSKMKFWNVGLVNKKEPKKKNPISQILFNYHELKHPVQLVVLVFSHLKINKCRILKTSINT